MKKKQAIRRLDEMTDELDQSKLVTNAPITTTEAEAIRVGVMAGMLEAMSMLRDDTMPHGSAKAQAEGVIGRCVDVYVRHLARGGSDE